MLDGKLIAARGGDNVEWHLFWIGQRLPQSFVIWARIEGKGRPERVRVIAEAWDGRHEGAQHQVATADLLGHDDERTVTMMWSVTLAPGGWTLKLYADNKLLAKEYVDVEQQAKAR